MAPFEEIKKANETTEEDLKFLSGIININPMLISNLERRMPKYKYSRFENVCDVIKSLPVKVNSEAKIFLDIPLDSSSLKYLVTY